MAKFSLASILCFRFSFFCFLFLFCLLLLFWHHLLLLSDLAVNSVPRRCALPVPVRYKPPLLTVMILKVHNRTEQIVVVLAAFIKAETQTDTHSDTETRSRLT